jgi:beta-lactam-binding protein with PASTA domain
MTIQVGYRYVSGKIVVGYWKGSPPALPTITAAPTVQDGATITINGTSFSGSGNRVFVGNTEVTVNTESTTQIVTQAFSAVRESMIRPVTLYVLNASGVQSNLVSLTIQPASGQRVFAVTQLFLGDRSTRLEGTPDLEVGDEIIVRAVTGTNVTVSDVNVTGIASADVASDTDSDPDVVSFEYAIFDGEQRSATWAEVDWAALASTTTVPNVAGLTQAAADAAALAASMTSVVIESVASATVAAGLVITQFPPATTTVPAGSVLELTISLGLTAGVAPDLRNLTSAEAAAAATSAGYVLGAVRAYIDGNNSGLVVNQSIAPGTPIAAGATIDVAISSNVEPNVVGQTYAAGISILNAANLVVDDLATVFVVNAAAAGTISSQSPPAASTVTPLTVVTLTVSLGEEPEVQVVVLPTRPPITLRQFLLG